MAQGEIRQGDIGTTFKGTVKDNNSDVVDLSSATTKQLIFKKPNNGDLVTQTATFTTDGTDGVIQYVVVAGDLDTTGSWSLQGKFILSSGTWKTDVKDFFVHPNLT